MDVTSSEPVVVPTRRARLATTLQSPVITQATVVGVVSWLLVTYVFKTGIPLGFQTAIPGIVAVVFAIIAHYRHPTASVATVSVTPGTHTPVIAGRAPEVSYRIVASGPPPPPGGVTS